MPIARAKTSHPDPYALHRLALLPLREPTARASAIDAITAAGPDHFFAFLARHGLGQVWREYLVPISLPAPLEPWRAKLSEHARLTAAHQMLQRQAVARLAEGLQGDDIPWFLFKGADLREWLYEDPVLRPVSDIDLFIRASDRQRTLELAQGLGFDLRFDPGTSSHEATLQNGQVAIDLHWHLFRPGRARPGLDDWLFTHRELHEGIPGLDATASLWVMLVHPAITKYLLSPTSMLIHQVDQARLIRGGNVDWAELEGALTRFGCRTASWSSLYVLRALAGVAAPDVFIGGIQPGMLHRAYLRQWIDRAWISRWFERRWMVAGLFSLALQDSTSDAWRAWRAQRNAQSKPLLPDFP